MEWKKKKALAPLTSDAAEDDWILMLYEAENDQDSEDRIQLFRDDSSDISSDGVPTLASNSSGSVISTKVRPQSPVSSSPASSLGHDDGDDWRTRLAEMERQVDELLRNQKNVLHEWEDFPVEDWSPEEALQVRIQNIGTEIAMLHEKLILVDSGCARSSCPTWFAPRTPTNIGGAKPPLRNPTGDHVESQGEKIVTVQLPGGGKGR